MIPETSTIALRADLIQRQVWMGTDPMWVVKDPLSRAMFYFNEQEHSILSLADGKTTFKQIAARVLQRMTPELVSQESLARFFTEAQHQGLVSIGGSDMTQRLPNSDLRHRWWRNPLALRVPGINPDRLLDRCLPIAKFLFSRNAALVIIALIITAIVIVVQQFETLAGHLSVATARFASGQGLVALLAVVSATKIIHEFAHALACKRFGGECRELGVMFLVGVPCLYCDVSDAWLLDRRWKRMFVSAAGMLAELSLAAVATLIWVFTADGAIRDLCVTVMVVCSITTFVFNGNPLLRYDGYYILSDLVGIPNLASRSGRVIRVWMRRVLWGETSSIASIDNRKPFLVGYGIASGVYRTAIYCFILYMLYRFADNHGFGIPAGTAALTAGLWFSVRLVRPVLQPPRAHAESLAAQRSQVSSWRAAFILGGATASLLFIGMIPLPHRVVAPMSVQPLDAAEVFVTDAGAIVASVAEGRLVHAGDVIAELRDPEMERELESIRARCARLSVELDGLRSRRGTSRADATRIPVVESALKEAIKQRQLQQDVAQRLKLTSPKDGRVFAAPTTASPQTMNRDDDRHPRFWTGTPMQPINRGAWLDEGTVVCVVGDPSQREAVVLVPQDQIEWIRTRQRATLLLADRKRGSVTGEVIEISATPIREFSEPGDRVAGVDDPIALAAPRYQVRILLDETPHGLPARMTGLARISVDHSSFLARIGRFLRQSFG